jgi:hypothetical protein
VAACLLSYQSVRIELCAHCARGPFPAAAGVPAKAFTIIYHVYNSIDQRRCHPAAACAAQRPTRIKIKAQTLAGKKVMLSLSGFPARIFQHEYDHLQVRSRLPFG